MNQWLQSHGPSIIQSWCHQHAEPLLSNYLDQWMLVNATQLFTQIAIKDRERKERMEVMEREMTTGGGVAAATNVHHTSNTAASNRHTSSHSPTQFRTYSPPPSGSTNARHTSPLAISRIHQSASANEDMSPSTPAVGSPKPSLGNDLRAFMRQKMSSSVQAASNSAAAAAGGGSGNSPPTLSQPNSSSTSPTSAPMSPYPASQQHLQQHQQQLPSSTLPRPLGLGFNRIPQQDFIVPAPVPVPGSSAVQQYALAASIPTTFHRSGSIEELNGGTNGNNGASHPAIPPPPYPFPASSPISPRNRMTDTHPTSSSSSLLHHPLPSYLHLKGPIAELVAASSDNTAPGEEVRRENQNTNAEREISPKVLQQLLGSPIGGRERRTGVGSGSLIGSTSSTVLTHQHSISGNNSSSSIPHSPSLSLSSTSSSLPPSPTDILIVEDVRVAQKWAHHVLTRVHYKVEIAASGEQAIEKYRNMCAQVVNAAHQHGSTNTNVLNNRLKVILMDISLPGMNGCEATEKIRKIEAEMNVSLLQAANAVSAAAAAAASFSSSTSPLTPPSPSPSLTIRPLWIYGLTGNVEPDDLARYRASGMNGCILKGRLLADSVRSAVEINERPGGEKIFVNMCEKEEKGTGVAGSASVTNGSAASCFPSFISSRRSGMASPDPIARVSPIPLSVSSAPPALSPAPVVPSSGAGSDGVNSPLLGQGTSSTGALISSTCPPLGSSPSSSSCEVTSPQMSVDMATSVPATPTPDFSMLSVDSMQSSSSHSHLHSSSISPTSAAAAAASRFMTSPLPISSSSAASSHHQHHHQQQQQYHHQLQHGFNLIPRRLGIGPIVPASSSSSTAAAISSSSSPSSVGVKRSVSRMLEDSGSISVSSTGESNAHTQTVYPSYPSPTASSMTTAAAHQIPPPLSTSSSLTHSTSGPIVSQVSANTNSSDGEGGGEAASAPAGSASKRQRIDHTSTDERMQ